MNVSIRNTGCLGTRQVAIATGAARGIGVAVATRLGRNGYALVVDDAGSPDDAARVVDTICDAGERAIAMKADVAGPSALRHLFDQAVAQFGRIDVLVNNAGFMPPALPPLAGTDDKASDALFAVNVKGSFNTMREAGRGWSAAAGSSTSRAASSASRCPATPSMPQPRARSRR